MCAAVSDDLQISRCMTALMSLGKASGASQPHCQLSCRHAGLRFDKAGDSVGNRDLHRCRLDLERERSTLSGYSVSLPRKSVLETSICAQYVTVFSSGEPESYGVLGGSVCTLQVRQRHVELNFKMVWTVQRRGRSSDEDEVNIRMIVRHVDSEYKSGLRRRNFEWTLLDSVTALEQCQAN